MRRSSSLLIVACWSAASVDRAWADPPQKLSIPPAAEGKVAKLQCASGSISIVTAQYGVNCPDCTSCKADPKGNAYESTATACEGKADCAVTVCYEPHQPPSSALQPCVGTSPVPKDPAFGCGKSYEVTYTCDSGWGTSLIIALLVVSALYVGGGSAYNVKAKGATPGLDMLPHQEFWQEVYGLVSDGARFTKATADTAMGKPKSAEYDAIGEPKESKKDSSSSSGPGGAAKKQVDPDSPLKAADDDKPLFGEGSDGGDDDDDLVE